MANVTATVDICSECGFALDSREHLEGRGLHGHVTFSDEETEAQRAAVRDGIAAQKAEMLADEIAFLEARLADAKSQGADNEPVSVEKPLARMNKGELRAVAEGEGLFLEDGMTNAEMVEAIEDAREAAALLNEDTGTPPEE